MFRKTSPALRVLNYFLRAAARSPERDRTLPTDLLELAPRDLPVAALADLPE
jgi:hypothetical protein